MAEYLAEVDATFRKFIPNTDPDKKLIKYWANALAKGDKDRANLMVYISKHTDYINFVKYTFIDMYYDHLSNAEDNDIGKLFDKMMVAQDNGSPMTQDDVWRWLSNTDAFQKQYADIINKMFISLQKRQSTPGEVHDFLCRLKVDRSYTVDMLQKDIENVGRESDVLDSSLPSDMHDVLDANKLDDGFSNNSILNDMQSRFQIDFEIVDVYEKAFERTMNVREYILYIEELRAARRANCLTEHINTVRTAHTTVFARVKEIMHMSLNTYISEEEFIVSYLARAQDESFLDNLKHEVFDSDAYKTKMVDRLVSIYSDMYGETMSNDDAAYMFTCVKDREVELVSDELNQIVAVFKAENDEIVQQIFDIFFDVLDREPDLSEQAKYVLFIREKRASTDNHDTESIKDAIVLDLKQSLEYNDVLKKKITAAYAKFSSDALFPSKVYQVLDKIVPVKHYKDIDNRIELAVQEILLD